ncbi:MAG TPA: Crp/Fnr family transcriptional regulator [Bacteroidia bacterium]
MLKKNRNDKIENMQSTNEIPRCQKCCEDFFCVNTVLNKHCTSEQKRLLQKNIYHHNYKRGEVIFYDFQPAAYTYIIVSGKVKLWKEGIHTHHMITSFAKEGDIMGFRGCQRNSNYVLSATAIEDSRICHIPKDIFMGIINKNQEMHFNILWHYITQLERIEKRMRNIAEMNIREKTADTLMLLFNEFGLAEDESTINIKLSREDFASVAGICTDRVVKQFSEFEEENLIEVKGKSIKIKKLNDLQRIIAPYTYTNGLQAINQ